MSSWSAVLAVGHLSTNLQRGEGVRNLPDIKLPQSRCRARGKDKFMGEELGNV